IAWWLFVCSSDGYPRDLHSFPTRRSSDLAGRGRHGEIATGRHRHRPWTGRLHRRAAGHRGRAGHRPRARPADGCGIDPGGLGMRSEEHTSELQSRENLVCRLLLEKKKNGWTLLAAAVQSLGSLTGRFQPFTLCCWARSTLRVDSGSSLLIVIPYVLFSMDSVDMGY